MSSSWHQPAKAMEAFFRGWLDIQKNGFTTTNKLRHKRLSPPTYPWLVYNETSPRNINVGRWWGRTNTSICIYAVINDVVLINTDDLWGATGRRLRRDIAFLCEKYKQPYVCVSFAAAALAGIGDLRTIKLITSEPIQYHHITLPEDTPKRIKTATYSVKRFTRDRPKSRYYAYLTSKRQEGLEVAGWEWWERLERPIPPGKDGFYRWADQRFSRLMPGCVFEATVRRLVTDKSRKAKFISAFDVSDRPARYFLSELPKGAVTTSVEAATMSLAPEAVRIAWKQGRKVVRQGDVFAIKTDVKEKELMKGKVATANHRYWVQRLGRWRFRGLVGRRYKESQDKDSVCVRMQIHNTAHTATHLIRTEEGLVYAKGRLIHEPFIRGENRERDHQSKILDDGKTGWWLCVRNTVPAL